MAEVDACLYLIDCLPNMDADLVAERGEAFVKILRDRRPNDPILMVEDRTYGDAFIKADRAHRNETSRAVYRPIFDQLSVSDPNLYYLEGAGQLGDDDTVDGSHPTDLGFARMTDVFSTKIGEILDSR